MEYEFCDSSGTDDDFPQHQNSALRGGRIAVNGRSAVAPNPYSRMHIDMEVQIHQLEKEAYCAVLRAFKAQADAITWEKEGLITELRKELRVSDDEHRELLTKVNADDIIKRIRDWRNADGDQAARLATSQPVHDLLPSPSVSASRKRQKTSQSVSSVPSYYTITSFPTLPVAPYMQPSSLAANSGAAIRFRGKSCPVGSRSFINRSSGGAISANDTAEAGALDNLIGRKVWTRWPEDNNFYEAVVTDYNPAEGRHALVYYDSSTRVETWEWVDLKEIPREDIRWEGQDAGISYRGGHNGQGRGMKKHIGRGGPIPGAGKGRGTAKGQGQFRKEFMSSQNRIEKVSDDIELLNTETLVKEVERIVDAINPDPLELAKAKKMLKEHEQALVDAIAKLGDASDGESDGEDGEGQGQEQQQDHE